MFVLALTGGLGAGKSTAVRYFAERGATVLGLDEVAARLMTPGSELLDRVVQEFGDQILKPDGSLDRAALASAAFVTPDATSRLNGLVHPAVEREVCEALDAMRLAQRHADVVVLEIPLLAEAPELTQVADEVLAIEAPESLRIQRAVARGMSEQDARRRVSRQASDARRAALAHEVIVNDGDREAFLRKLEKYWEKRVQGGESAR